jgi:hypothetical protein
MMESSNFHGGDYKDLLGCCAVYPCRNRPTLQRCLQPPSSGKWFKVIILMMEAVRASETSASVCNSTRRNIPDDSHL